MMELNVLGYNNNKTIGHARDGLKGTIFSIESLGCTRPDLVNDIELNKYFLIDAIFKYVKNIIEFPNKVVIHFENCRSVKGYLGYITLKQMHIQQDIYNIYLDYTLSPTQFIETLLHEIRHMNQRMTKIYLHCNHTFYWKDISVKTEGRYRDLPWEIDACQWASYHWYHFCRSLNIGLNNKRFDIFQNRVERLKVFGEEC